MKIIPISILIAILIIGGVVLFTRDGSNEASDVPMNNVIMENGKQIITITAKGGYQPVNSVAQAGVPTVIRFNTRGTFDCSSSVRIPSLNIAKVLPQNGSTDIDIGTPAATTLQGSCGMGMYPFSVTFQG